MKYRYLRVQLVQPYMFGQQDKIETRLEAREVKNGVVSRDSQQEWLKRKGTSTHKQEKTIGSILGCIQREDHVLSRSQKSFLQFQSLFSMFIFCIFKLIYKPKVEGRKRYRTPIWILILVRSLISILSSKYCQYLLSLLGKFQRVLVA